MWGEQKVAQNIEEKSRRRFMDSSAGGPMSPVGSPLSPSGSSATTAAALTGDGSMAVVGDAHAQNLHPVRKIGRFFFHSFCICMADRLTQVGWGVGYTNKP